MAADLSGGWQMHMTVLEICDHIIDLMKSGRNFDAIEMLQVLKHRLEIEDLPPSQQAVQADAETPCDFCGGVGYHKMLCMHIPCK